MFRCELYGGDEFPLFSLLTGDEEHDSCNKGAVESLKGGEVGEGHDAGDDARKTGHPRQDHEGPGCIPIGCRVQGERVTIGLFRCFSCALVKGCHFPPAWDNCFSCMERFLFYLIRLYNSFISFFAINPNYSNKCHNAWSDQVALPDLTG